MSISYAGIDYIRVTTPMAGRYQDWLEILRPEFTESAHHGVQPKLRGMLGYYGWFSQHGYVGRSEQGCMAQSSGSSANHYFTLLSHADGRASRLDLQTTMPVGCNPSEFIRYTFLACQEREKKRGHQPLIAINDTSNGARMLTIGSRQSEVYGRVYDKFTESKDERYRDMVRFEIEIKGKQARDTQNFLLEGGTLIPTSKHIVSNWMADKGVEADWHAGVLSETLPQSKRSRSDETKLAWMATQVRPSVEMLLKHGKGIEVARTLLPDDASDEDVDSLCLLMLKSWRAND